MTKSCIFYRLSHAAAPHCVVFSIQSFTSLVKFTPKYLTLFVDTLNRMIFFSDCLLLIYRNVTDFCILFLYLATLPNSFISFDLFFGGIFSFFPYILESFVLFCFVAARGSSFYSCVISRNQKDYQHLLFFLEKGRDRYYLLVSPSPGLSPLWVALEIR